MQPQEGIEASLNLKHTSDTTTHAFKLCAFRLDSTVDAETFTRTLEVLLATVHKMGFQRGYDAGKLTGIQQEKDERAAGREKLGVKPDKPAAAPKDPKGLNKLTNEQKIEIRKRIVQAKLDYKDNLPRGFLSDLAREFHTPTHNVFHISYGLKLDDRSVS